MLVGFIGVPYSGKTTVAAKLFAYLKEEGISAEFLPEAARLYIAELRCETRSNGMDDTISLLDRDQRDIMVRQLESEIVMTTACGDESVVVTDSCVLNTLLYMSDKLSKDFLTVQRVTSAISQYDLMFVCGLLPRTQVQDPNRVHSEAQSIVLVEKLTQILIDYKLEDRVIFLDGSSEHRFGLASRATLHMRSSI